MNLINYFMGVATLIASSYISIVVFFVIHRMNKHTPWGMASWVISVGALGAMGALKSLIYVFGLCPTLNELLAIANIAVGTALAISPRIDVHKHDRIANQ